MTASIMNLSPVVPNPLAATLEIHYLRPLLESLPSDKKTALDVGAHKGDVTEALAGLGFDVLAVEPQDYMADRFAARHADRINAGAIILSRCAASDRAGEAELLIGSASTVSTLEPRWTSVAFPEEFSSRRSMRVAVVTLAKLIRQHDFGPVGFAKIDVEGHEFQAMAGLFDGETAPPPILMFEANQRFANEAGDCLALLRDQGYRAFDIFIRIGVDVVAAERFTDAVIPSVWHSCGDRYFYANIIAYHASVAGDFSLLDPIQFVRQYQLDAARRQLCEGLKIEATHPVPVHPVWQEARLRLREHLLQQDWHDFLRHPICKEMFVRGRWGPAQDRELREIEETAFGRNLLGILHDPPAGAPRFTERFPGLSTNMLAMAWYLTRIHQQTGGLPTEVIEIGGGYGALAYAYLRARPQSQYVIVDLPEMLAIQHYFLTLALPNHPVVFATSLETVRPVPGQVTLVPISLAVESGLACDLLISTFALSEMPRELQRRIEKAAYFSARRVFIAGQLSTEFPGMDLVSHGEVIGAAAQRFPRLRIERFHIGDNYVLLGQRDQEEAA